MGTFYTRKYTNNKRILRTVKADGITDIYNDSDIFLRAGFNTGATPRWLKYNFGGVQSKIIVRLNWGTNTYLMQEYTNVSEVTLDIMPGVNGNGNNVEDKVCSFYISIYLSNPENVTDMTFTSNSGNNRPVWGTLIFNKRFTSLQNINISPMDITNYLNWEILPTLDKLIVTHDNPSNYWNSSMALCPSLKYIVLNKITGEVTSFPNSLQYIYLTIFSIGNFDLKTFFNNSNRMGFRIRIFSNGANNISYSGGGTFAENIVETSSKPIDYIIELANTQYMLTKPTPDMISQLLIDFANQVKTVTLVNKRIRFQGLSANTSYVDSTKPLYTTYNDALNYITNTLGITVSFT